MLVNRRALVPFHAECNATCSSVLAGCGSFHERRVILYYASFSENVVGDLGSKELSDAGVLA
jgi:hypothetical protein